MTIGKTSKVKVVRPPFPLYKRFPSKLEQTAYLTYNAVENKTWPIRPEYVLGASAAIAAYHVMNPSNWIMNVLPKTTHKVVEAVEIGLVSLASAYLPSFLIRRFLKYVYFSYKGFLFENPKKPSIATRIWGMVRFLLSFSPPRLQSTETLLPKLPVPSLQETVQKYLDSIKHVVSEDEYTEIESNAKSFLENEGRKLQMYAKVYNLFTTNYVSSFWRQYAYLYSREPLLINSSVAHVDLFVDQPATRAYRAAHVVFIETLSPLAIHRQNYKPLGEGLLCSCHYDNMYTVTRVPGEKMDQLKDHGISKHVAVYLRGNIYRLEICDQRGNIYSIDQLTKIFDELINRPEEENGPLAKVAALTCDRRDAWARNRDKFFLQNSTNKKALEIIESAVLFLILDENDVNDYDPKDPSKLDGFLRDMLTGNGANRWCDKSLNYIVDKNTRCGGTTEHSIADGSEFDHIMENYVYMDTEVVKYLPLEDQKVLTGDLAVKEGLQLAKKIEIELVDDEMSSEIERCYRSHVQAADDVDLAATIFRDWGKGRIKKCGCSPDAFVQMAIQLANYREQGKFVLTYEPASVRFYRNSRTETLRTVGDESCAFVKAMLDDKCTKQEKIRVLKTACERHVQKNKECMVGKGIDRHLFVLYVLSQGFGISSPFLDTYINQKWTLSTSHIPNVTQQVDEDANIGNSWIGACFAAVAKDGYGICYRFAGNHSICAHISSFHSAENTDSHRFQKLFLEALQEMAELFD